MQDTPPRLVPLAGTTNFRDLGGYPTVDGRTTKWRTLYRADGLYRLTPRTGRTHQLRVHMASLGLPIHGDPLYPAVTDVTPSAVATHFWKLVSATAMSHNDVAILTPGPKYFPVAPSGLKMG